MDKPKPNTPGASAVASVLMVRRAAEASKQKAARDQLKLKQRTPVFDMLRSGMAMKKERDKKED